ncbi:MAG: ATP-dependent 6-phosphofructokinase [Polyangiaceae bacterium]|nr:ATP-dependent 6-phosphofructokinase [Polyangiaceae bacterium]
MQPIRKIAISTGGGDAPGLNAVIRAATLAAMEQGWEVWGIKHGFRGLIDPSLDELVCLDRKNVRGILRIGGTILGTANRGNPFSYPTLKSDSAVPVPADRSEDLIRRFHEEGFDALISVGGDGSMRIAHELLKRGLPRVIGVPKTIDNDVYATELTFGFDTAVDIATEAIDRLHTTAEAHERIMVVEVMGRHAGWIALHSGIAGGADVILMPEVPFRLERVVEKIRQREARDRRFSIVVVAEGARSVDGEIVTKEVASPGEKVMVLGGIGEQVTKTLAEMTGKEARNLVLGHLQRGGGPTTFDRLLALRFGTAAVRFLAQGAESGMVALRDHTIVLASLEEAATRTKTVPLTSDTMVTAREMGICFGDEPAGTFKV